MRNTASGYSIFEIQLNAIQTKAVAQAAELVFTGYVTCARTKEAIKVPITTDCWWSAIKQERLTEMRTCSTGRNEKMLYRRRSELPEKNCSNKSSGVTYDSHKM